MVSSEVQRTLVKSPPELWAELSDPAALARHLGELGEIRITATKPEERVEWEADGASGTVRIKSSGWGTRVTLSATREIEESTSPPSAGPLEAALDVEPVPEQAVAEAPSPSSPSLAQPEPSPTPEVNPEPPIEQRRGFFSRLFGRRARPTSEPEPTAVAEPEPAVVAEPEPRAVDEGVDELTPPLTAPPLAAELKAAEEIAAEQVTAVLNAVLDRLGAAHHRPFSRA
jgi:hypothetical protein